MDHLILDARSLLELFTTDKTINSNTIEDVEKIMKDRDIFFPNIQMKIYNILNRSNHILIQGGTGIGKTRFVPLLIYNYVKNHLHKQPKIIISEPRRSTAADPAKRMLEDNGQAFEHEKGKTDINVKVEENDIISEDAEGVSYTDLRFKNKQN